MFFFIFSSELQSKPKINRENSDLHFGKVDTINTADEYSLYGSLSEEKDQVASYDSLPTPPVMSSRRYSAGRQFRLASHLKVTLFGILCAQNVFFFNLYDLPFLVF